MSEAPLTCSRGKGGMFFGWGYNSWFRKPTYTYDAPTWGGAYALVGGRTRTDPHQGGIERLANAYAAGGHGGGVRVVVDVLHLRRRLLVFHLPPEGLQRETKTKTKTKTNR